MKRALMVLGVVVVCLPMVFVCWLMAAARWPKMDRTTVRMPMEFRQMVAQVVSQKAKWDDRPTFARVVVLDPQNALGWDGLCSSQWVEKDPKTELENCRKAEALMESASDYSVMGNAQEKLGDECGAAESYRKASAAAAGNWAYLESMGKAALKCGDLPDARAALEAAIDVEKKVPADEDADDDAKKDAADALSTDRELLIVTFNRMKQPDLAKAMCKVEHPGWKGCSCGLNVDGEVECEEK